MSRSMDWSQLAGGNDRDSQAGNKYRNMDISEYWLRLAGSPGGTDYRVRLLGMPEPLLAHYPKVRSENGKDWDEKPFPDADERNKFKRVCTDPKWQEEGRSKSRCVWCRMGYQLTGRVLANVIHREDGKVKIVELPKMVGKEIGNWWVKNQEDYGDATGPGDMNEAVPDWMITVTGSGRNTRYTTTSVGKDRKLTEDDIKAIKAINPEATTPEEEMQLHDLQRFSRGDYLAEEKQIEEFGKVVQENPFASNRSETSEPAAEKPAKAPVADEEDEEDIPEISRPAAEDEDEDEKPAAKSVQVADEVDEDDTW